jgi:hypothetical protein
MRVPINDLRGEATHILLACLGGHVGADIRPVVPALLVGESLQPARRANGQPK